MRDVQRARIALLVLLLLAGCSSGGTKVSAGTSTSTTAANGAPAGLDAYRACLKDHGVDLPTGFGGQRPGGTATGSAQRPPGNGGQPPAAGQRTPRSLPAGVDQQAFQAAQEACASKRPAGGRPGGGANATELKAYASCLSDHGVTVTTTGTGAQQRPQVDRTDPDFAAADQTCAALRPQPGQPGSTTTVPAGQQ